MLAKIFSCRLGCMLNINFIMAKFSLALKSKLQSAKRHLIIKLTEIKSDYVAAGKDTWADSKMHPLKSLIYVGAFSFGIYTYKHVPSESNYIATVVECSNDLLLQSDATRNKDSDKFVQSVLGLCNGDRLRYKRLGFFSVMYTAEFNKDNRTYVAQCKYTNPKWMEFHKRVLDIGFLERWWILQYIMTDYDVDLNEMPKEFNSVWSKYFDHLKMLFGYSYYHIKSQPQKASLYVFTPADDVNSVS